MTRNQQQREAGPKLIPAPLPPFPSSYGLSSSFPSGLIDQNPYAGLSPISPPSYPYQPYSSFASPNPQSSTPFFFPSHLPFPINTSVEPDHAPFYPPPEPSMALNYLQLQHPPSQQPGLVLDDLPSSSSSSSFPLSPDSLRGGGSAWHGFQEGLVSIDAVGKDETPTTRLDETTTGSGSPSTEEKGTGALLGEGLLGEQTAFVSKVCLLFSVPSVSLRRRIASSRNLTFSLSPSFSIAAALAHPIARRVQAACMLVEGWKVLRYLESRQVCRSR